MLHRPSLAGRYSSERAAALGTVSRRSLCTCNPKGQPFMAFQADLGLGRAIPEGSVQLYD